MSCDILSLQWKIVEAIQTSTARAQASGVASFQVQTLWDEMNRFEGQLAGF